MEIKQPVNRYRGPTFQDRKAERVRLKERAICEAEHQDRMVPHNGFGWTGTRCSQCGFMFFGGFEPGFLGAGQPPPIKP